MTRAFGYLNVGAWIATLFLGVLVTGSLGQTAEPSVDVNSFGKVERILSGNRFSPASFEVMVFSDGFSKNVGAYAMRDAQITRGDGKIVVEGKLPFGGAELQIRQEWATADSKTVATIRVQADKDMDLDGVFLMLNAPVQSLQGGSVRIDDKQTPLPVEFGEKSIDSSPAATQAALIGIGGYRLAFDFGWPAYVTAQDMRAFNSDEYGLMVTFHPGKLAAGQVVQRTFGVSLESPFDESPVAASADFDSPIAAFHGFGGNFVYGIDSRQTQANLATLPMAWARIEAVLDEWEPTNDNDDPAVADPAAFGKLDTDGSKLRRRFELDRQLMKLSEGRLILSSWRIPEWMYTNPVTGWRNSGDVVNPAMWDELAENVTTYLLHLKEDYGVEPALFSFNESDYGVNVKLPADDYLRHVLLLGKRFEAAGLTTKLMLADAASLNLAYEQVAPTLDSPEAMKHIGAVGYHPWGFQRDSWDKWAKIAEQTKLPLLVTEVGADAQAWRGNSVNTLFNTLDDIRLFLQLLSESRGQALLTWEWTSDYGLFNESDKGVLAPTMRYWLHWQLANLTPRFGKTFKVTSDRSDVPIAAAAGKIGDAEVRVVHIGNLEDARTLTLSGLGSAASMHAIQSTWDGGIKRLADVPVIDGVATIGLAAQSLTSLTTGQIPDPPTRW